jgi:hypothetical protein
MPESEDYVRGGVQMVDLAGQLLPYATAAIAAYGTAVLHRAEDDAADATVGAGRRVLQRIFGKQTSGAQLPMPIADVLAAPKDGDASAALRFAIRKALDADLRLRDDVERILAGQGMSITAAGDRSIAAHTITGGAVTGDNATVNQ